MAHATTLGQPAVLADLIPAARARDIALVVGGALLTAVCAQISIPVPGSPVPVTGQTFAVMLCGAGLGAVRGSAAMALYWLLGMIGLPFYADGEGGIHAAFGATGGYLVGFIVAALLIGWLAQRQWDRRFNSAVAAMLTGSVVIYAFGLPWLAHTANLGLEETLEAGLYPFVVGDLLKLYLAGMLLPAAWKLVRHLRG